MPACSSRTLPPHSLSTACGWETTWETFRPIRTVQCHTCVLPTPTRLPHRTHRSQVCPMWLFQTPQPRPRSIPPNSNHVTFHPSHQTGMPFEHPPGARLHPRQYDHVSCRQMLLWYSRCMIKCATVQSKLHFSSSSRLRYHGCHIERIPSHMHAKYKQNARWRMLVAEVERDSKRRNQEVWKRLIAIVLFW